MPRDDKETLVANGADREQEEEGEGSSSSRGSSEEPEDADRPYYHPRMMFPSLTNMWDEMNKESALSVLVLVYVNLINYMDRSTVAGMLEKIKTDKDFDIKKDRYLGLLQTAFVVCYMVFAPVFGYLGDRYSRKWLLGIGIGFWSLSTLIGSFMKSYPLFLVFRALVGVGEASYSTVAPAIISDLYEQKSRSSVLAIFYFAIPVGTGLGYIVGSEVAGAVGDWRWGLRVTPVMGALAVLGIMFLMTDPPRGKADNSKLKPTSPWNDVRALAKNKSFCLSTVAFTCVTYCAGAMMWWGPNFAFAGAKSACGNKAGCESITLESISYKFGIVMTISGLLGVPIGSYISQNLRLRTPNADPLVCAYTLLLSVPVLFFGFVSANHSLPICLGLTFGAGLLLNANWSIVSDMTLYIVIPPRRAIASATQILFSHFLGDAFSPYLIGALADFFKPYIHVPTNPDIVHGEHAVASSSSPSLTPEQYDLEFKALQYSLFSCCFAQALGALFFFFMSFYILDDKTRAEEQMAREITEREEEDEEEEGEGGEGDQPVWGGPIVRAGNGAPVST